MDYEKLIKERVLKGDYRKVYSLEEIWKWIEWGLKRELLIEVVMIRILRML